MAWRPTTTSFTAWAAFPILDGKICGGECCLDSAAHTEWIIVPSQQRENFPLSSLPVVKTKSYSVKLIRVLRGVLPGLMFLAGSWANAVTLWTEDRNTNFIQFLPDPSDQITPNVAISRGTSGPLYNSAPPYSEISPNGFSSPEDTLWAFGSINNYSNLSYQTFAAIRNNASQNLGAVLSNQPMVLQLVSEQIYISLEFTVWGEKMHGGFSYTRSTAPAVVAPSVNLTNPASNAVFSAPANIKLGANATVSSGTVTNVSFFGNSTSLGAATNAPFSVTASNLTGEFLCPHRGGDGLREFLLHRRLVNITVVDAGSRLKTSSATRRQ